MALPDRVLARWRERGVVINPPATPDAIAAFEGHYDLRLPLALAELLSRANGTSCADRELISFWRLPMLGEGFDETLGIIHPVQSKLAGVGECFLAFADYASFSSLFFVRIGGELNGAVYFHALDKPISGSFSGFLELYLQKRLPWDVV